MLAAVTSLLENFSHQDRDAGRQLTLLLKQDPASFQRAVVHCVSKGGQLPGTRLLVWVLEKERKLLDMLLNPQLSSLEDAIQVAKVMKTIVNQLDVLLARELKEVPEELALRILRLLAEVANSNRTLPLLTKTLREASPGLRSQAALIFSRHCHNSLFIENALKDPDPEVRASAIQGLGESEYQPDPSIVTAAFTDSDPSVRVQAALVCHRIGEADEAFQMLGAMSRHEEPGFRAQAAWALGEIGSRPCVFLLARLRNDPASEVRAQAGEALAKHMENQSANGSAAGDADFNELEIDSIFAAVDERGRRRICVAVLDGRGEPITDFAEEDFHIEEGGVEIAHSHFESPSHSETRSRWPSFSIAAEACQSASSARWARRLPNVSRISSPRTGFRSTSTRLTSNAPSSIRRRRNGWPR